MAPSVIEACKSRKRKRRVWGIGSSGSGLNGPFRENIKMFLQEYGEFEKYSVCGMPVWSTLVVSETNEEPVFRLFVVEEFVLHSLNPFCNHCKFIG